MHIFYFQSKLYAHRYIITSQCMIYHNFTCIYHNVYNNFWKSYHARHLRIENDFIVINIISIHHFQLRCFKLNLNMRMNRKWELYNINTLLIHHESYWPNTYFWFVFRLFWGIVALRISDPSDTWYVLTKKLTNGM